MSFVILQAVMKRLEERRKVRLFAELGSTMKLPRSAESLGLEVIDLADCRAPADDAHPGVPRQARPGRLRLAAALRVLVAPDSFKGSLSSVEVAHALAAGWSRARPDDEVTLAPMADGGEGTLDAVAAAGGWRTLPAAARDPLMRPIDGRFLRQGPRAIVELATASGLSRVTREERDAAAATTLGTGQIMAAAIGLGCTEIVLGLGGSATTDGGTGLLTALGVRFLDAAGRGPGAGRRGPGAAGPGRPSPTCPSCWRRCRLTIASDVSNPLCGPLGAAATYGPQKGARPGGGGAAGPEPGPPGRRAGGGHRAVGPGRAGRGRGRRHDRGAARDRRPVPCVRDPAGRRAGDGADGVRGAARGVRPGAHRRGAHRRADGVRQDRAGGRAAGGGGRRALRGVRRGRDGRPGRRRCASWGAWRCRSRSGRSPWRRRWPPAPRPWSVPPSAPPGWCRSAGRWVTVPDDHSSGGCQPPHPEPADDTARQRGVDRG